MISGYDTIVIGAGMNGLVCASYLAKAGRKVLVLEARDTVGGMAGGDTIGGNYFLPGLAHWSYPLDSAISSDLQLVKHGLVDGEPIETIALDADGEHLTLGHDRVAGPGLSDDDVAAYASFKKDYRKFANSIAPILENKPPRLKDMDFADKMTLARSGLRMRFGLGRDLMREFMRVAGMNIYDVLNDTFDDERLKGAIAVDAVMGHHMGPRTPGTVLTYLMRSFGERNGQMTQLTIGRSRACDALEQAAESFGAEIRTGAKVSSIQTGDDGVTAVELSDGEVISAKTIVSSIDARSTLLNMLGAPKLDAMFANRVSKIRGAGDVAKLHIALDGLPMFPGLSEAMLKNRLVIAPSQRYVEQAFDFCKYGGFSEDPVLEITIPSMLDPSLAPEGHHVASVSATYAPYALEGGWEDQKTSFAYRIIALIDRYAPGFKSHVVDHKILTPVDIEQQFGCTGGHWHHAEMTMHQSMMMRPVHGAAQYNMPVDGLYLCGAATHPGGGLHGLPGRNAAKQVLAGGR